MSSADIHRIAKLEPEILPRIVSRRTKLAARKTPNVGKAAKKRGNSQRILFDSYFPAERIGNKVISCNGADVTAQYERGARESLYLAKLFDCKIALLKERSPSCGKAQIYDGTFSGTLRDGNGVTAELLTANGIAVYGESQIDELLEVEE